MRNLSKTIAAVSLLIPASAYSLGVGDIKLHSALNQNLDAEIALHVSGDEKFSDIRVRLANPEKFEEAGVPWSYFLSKIKIEPIIKADGSAIVSLKSREALREPFLNFLIEVSWGKGNLFREFTVLVDPPVAYSKPVVPVIEKAIQSRQVNTFATKANVNYVEPGALYGPIVRSESLWKIAEKVNSGNDISIEQMMMAIYEANPDAFYRKNVNALKAGKTIDIPEREVILALSKKAAKAAFKQQNNAWKGRVSTKKLKSTFDSDRENTQLELEAPFDSDIAKMVNGSSEKNASIDSDSKDLVNLSREVSLATQAKIGKLESQLEMMKRMLALKDEQIAALQNQDKSSIISEIDTTKTVETVVTEVKPKVDPLKVVKDKPITKPKIKVVKNPKPVVSEKTDTGLLSGLGKWILGGVGAIILGLFGLLLWRKRKIEEDTDTNSMFASASEISLPDSSFEEMTLDSEGSSSEEESSFLSEFASSDFDAFDSDQNEVDPISEADVYLAYGRYQQAEDLMRQAIDDDPERDECKLKLFEIFFANENKSAFAEYAKEVVDAGKNKDAVFWGKIVEMGTELDPETTFYADNADGKVKFDVDEGDAIGESAGDSLIDDFDLTVFDEDDENKEDVSSIQVDLDDKADDNSLDFDLNVFDSEETKPVSDSETETIADELDTIDFDLDSVDMDDSASGEESKDNKASEIDELESFEFDLPSETDSDVDNIDLNSDFEEDENLDFSLDDELLDHADTDLSENSVSLKDDLDITSSDIDDLDLEVSDLTDMDELETKIDLAKAYVDMGDLDSAKAIAEEVIDKGNKEQKEAAQAIIEQLK